MISIYQYTEHITDIFINLSSNILSFYSPLLSIYLFIFSNLFTLFQQHNKHLHVSQHTTGKIIGKWEKSSRHASFLHQDETKKKAEPKEDKKPDPKPFKMPKKSEKKETPPEPEPEPEFKLPKKKPSRQIPKEEPKEEESPFGKIKLKKAETVKRTWDDPGMESVDLKHHEFERAPQEEEVLKMTDDSGGYDMIIIVA